MSTMHEIDYKIFGDAMQFIEDELEPMEAAVAEAGAMMYMDDGIEMETIFGDGSKQSSGFLGSLISKPPEGAKFHPAGFLMSIVGAVLLLLLLRMVR